MKNAKCNKRRCLSGLALCTATPRTSHAAACAAVSLRNTSDTDNTTQSACRERFAYYQPRWALLKFTPQRRTFWAKDQAVAAIRLHASKHIAGNQEEFPHQGTPRLFTRVSFGIFFSVAYSRCCKKPTLKKRLTGFSQRAKANAPRFDRPASIATHATATGLVLKIGLSLND
ncbi:hypothetical protein [Caballeronia novacaledonica]|uniref:hypothetical protein n=1 Tax=Caballeronia novacaledonica TaxID=1544861 RepID=UPI0011B28812|nr:hypothetical protein [Caballeronia novacaledonica]